MATPGRARCSNLRQLVTGGGDALDPRQWDLQGLTTTVPGALARKAFFFILGFFNGLFQCLDSMDFGKYAF